MNKKIPDTAVRTAVFKAINQMSIDGKRIPCFDSVVNTSANADIPETYTILGAQNSLVDKDNKCDYFWNTDILIEVYTSEFSTGNILSRVFVENVLEGVRERTQNLTIDGFEVVETTMSTPSDIVTKSRSQTVIRKFLRLNLLLS